MVSAVQSAETGQRGYLLTGQDLYLGPYQLAQQRLPALLDRTQDPISDNPQQQQSLGHLRNLIQSKLLDATRPEKACFGNRTFDLSCEDCDQDFPPTENGEWLIYEREDA